MSEQVIVKGTGWRPELPSIHDFKFGKLHSEEKVAAAKVPSEFSIFKLLDAPLPDLDQGQQNSCTGHGTAYAVDMLRRMDDDKLSTLYSPAYVYFQARLAINEQKLDNGAYIRDAVISVINKGIAPNSVYKYREDVWFKNPTPSVDKAASRWKLDGSAYRIESFEQLRQAIASKYPVVGGISVYRNFWTSAKTGIVPMPAGPMEGGHCLCFGEYSDSTREVIAKGSYGKEFGGGYHRFPYAWFQQWTELCDDFWAVTKEARPDKK